MTAVTSAMDGKFRVMVQVSNTTTVPPPARFTVFPFHNLTQPFHEPLKRKLNKAATESEPAHYTNFT